MTRQKTPTLDELAESFERLAAKAVIEPVTVTKDGKAWVLLSAATYARLKHRDLSFLSDEPTEDKRPMHTSNTTSNH